jgi:DeoR/GlpR family transcriptional regulator of sugar metabolism
VSKISRGWVPQSFDEAIKRAAGRRRYNYTRRIKAELRRAELIEFVFEENGAYGLQAQAARRFGVSESTISRDMAAIMKGSRRCPHCGRYVMTEDDLSEALIESSEKEDFETL